MDRASSYPSQPRRDLKTHYLVAYNLMSSILWFAVLARVLILIPLVGFKNVSGGVGDFAKWTQTLAVLEIVNSASGLSSPLLPPQPTIRVNKADRQLAITRPCALRPTHDNPPSLLSPPPHLGHLHPLPRCNDPFAILQLHAGRLVRR